MGGRESRVMRTDDSPNQREAPVRAHRMRAWIIVALMLVMWSIDLARVWTISNHHDLDVFLRAASRLRSGATGVSIYSDAPAFKRAIASGAFSMKDDTIVWPYTYTPLIAMLFVPATFLPESVVQAGWWAVSVFALVLGCWLALRSLGEVTPPRLALVLLLLYRFQPVETALRIGQVELVQFALLATALAALHLGHERMAGLALGFAAGLKFFPGLLIALLLWRRRWRAALWATGTALVLIIGAFAAIGFDAVGEYL